jgi:hypothetical protein
MASGIIVILAALIPFLISLLQSRMTPAAKQEATNEDIEKAVVTGDVKYINTYLHDRVPDTSGSSRDTIRP